MNKKIVSGLLAGIMAFSISTAAFADTTAASANGYSISLSQVISKQQKTLTIGGKASSETVYTVPYGSTATVQGPHDYDKAAPGCDIYPSLGGDAYSAPDAGGMDSRSIKFDNSLFDMSLKGYLIKYYVRVYEGDDTPYVYVLVSDQKAGTGTSIKNYKIDTGAKLAVKSGKTYQFKITASSKPTFGCGNGSVFKVKYAGSKGSDYFFKVTAAGKAGQAAGFYVNGEKTPCTVATITGSENNYKIDTGAKLTVKSGKTYQFKITASSKPTFAFGNGSVFKVKYAGSKGSDYFFKVTAAGKAGQAAGFYVNGEKTPCTVATIA